MTSQNKSTVFDYRALLLLKQFIIAYLAIGSITSTGFCETIGNNNPMVSHSPSVKTTNAINLNTLGLAFGNISASYEHLFNGKHGLMMQGTFIYNSGYGAGVHYRHHYFSKLKHNGINSPFWGPFLYFEKRPGIATVTSDDSTEKYDFEITYLKAGLNAGRRWVWGAFTMAFRIGYGYPLIADFKWPPNESEEVKTIETIIKVIAGIDGELSIGFVF